MLVGEPPLMEKRQLVLQLNISKMQSRTLQILDKMYLKLLSNVILKATEKDVSDRYINIQAMTDDLSSALIDSRQMRININTKKKL